MTREARKELTSVYPKSDNSENVTLTFSKDTLKFSCKDYVVYKKDWFRSHYGAEIDIMCGDKQYLSDNSVLEDIKAEIIEHHEIGCDLNCKDCKMIACIEPKDVIADIEIINKHISRKETET